MSKLPRDLSGRKLVTVLERVGFYVLHQKGSHIILRRDDPKCTVSVPNHAILRVGTLRKILLQAGLDPQDFSKMIR